MTEVGEESSQSETQAVGSCHQIARQLGPTSLHGDPLRSQDNGQRPKHLRSEVQLLLDTNPNESKLTPLDSPSTAVSDMARLSDRDLATRCWSVLGVFSSRSLPCSHHHHQGNEGEPGEGDQHQRHLGPVAGHSGQHLPQQVRGVEGDHEDDGDPVREVAGLYERLYAGVE